MTDGFLHPAIARWTAIVAILLAGMLIPQSAQAAPSAYCPTLNASVSNGASVAIEVSSCDGPFDGGMSGPIAPFAQHGTVTIGSNSGGTQFVFYAHSGDAGTSDQFYLEDNDLGVVTVNITIAPPASPIAVSPGSLPALTAGTPFSQVLASTGGTAPYTYNLQSGALLPLGLSLTSNGLISGTPTQRGGYAFVVRSTDNIGQFVDKGYTGTVQNPTLSITPTSATAIRGVAFSQTLSASGGVAPYSYQVESGLLPPGIGLSSSGLISGTTTAAPGSYPLMLRVTDSSTGPGAYFELENFTLNVAASPSVSISLSPASVAEDGAATMIYTLTRSASLSSSTIVNMTRGGTATSGTDYTGATNTVTIPGGAMSAIIVIDPVADGDIEADETVVLAVVPGSGYTIATPSSATGTIVDDDRPTVSISVSPAQVSEDGAGILIYTATLDQPAPTTLAIDYLVGGTATNGGDYAAIASPIMIPAGSTSATVVVNPNADVTTEADETVVLTLAAGIGYNVGTPDSATGTILNDDLPTLRINNVLIPEDDSGTQSIPFIISLSSPAGPGGVTFDIATADGTATAGSDYVAKSLASQTIPAGSSTYNFSVDVNADYSNEADETFFANVTNVSNAILGDGQGVGTILNDDAPPSLSIDDVSVVEGNSGTRNLVFAVTLTGASGRTVTVNYATGDDTATQPGDYSGLSGELIFDPGETTQTIAIPVIGDAVPEADETFFINLSGAVNASVSDGQGVGTIVNDDVPVTLSPTSLSGGTVAAAYNQTVVASGGTTPYSYSVTSGTLPAGLTLSAGGALSGTPSAGGTFDFTITATDSSPAPGPLSGSQAYSLTIAPATLTLPSSPLASGQVGVAYSDTIEPATGGTAPYSYAVTAGALPAGITLSAGGALSGTPGADGTFTFSITATDSSAGTGPYSATQSYSLTIGEAAPLAGAVTATIPYGSSDNAIALDLSGGTATGVALATAPAHGAATVSGTSISYTPDTGFAGTDSFTYTASNTGGTSAPATVSVAVSAPVIDIAATGPLTATVGTAYSQSFTFSGGAQPFSAYQVTGLPAGLSVTGTTANSVAVGGTPNQSGSFTLNVSATDSSTGDGPFPASRSFTLSVNAPTLAMTPASGPLDAAYAAPFSQTFTASGGAGPYDYSITGTLPAGLTFNAASATLDGTPAAPGSYPVSITATDTGSAGPGAPFTITQSYTVEVAVPTIALTPASLPDATVAAVYSQTISSSGGASPYTYDVTTGALPTGLVLSPGGTLSGTPTAGGSFAFTVTATDDLGQNGSQSYNLTVAGSTVTLPATTLASGQVGVAYGDAIDSATGGTAPYSYAVTAGSLPDGVALSTSGTLSGTPTGSGTFTFSITATDSSTGTGPYSATQSYSLTIGEAAPLAGAVTATIPYGSSDNAIALDLSGGTAASVALATAPAHGTATVSGTSISYTPDTGFAGTDSFTYTASNTGGTSAPATVSVAVSAPVIDIAATGPLTATVGTAYSQSFTFSGGAQPFSAYQVTGLPTGLSVTGTTANSVTIAGTPVQSGSFTLNVSATDSSAGNGPFSTAQNFLLDVNSPALAMTPAAGALNAPYGAAFSQSFNAAGGIGPYSYAISGALPSGLSFTGDMLSGTPSVPGSYPISVTATDTGSTGPGSPFTITQNYVIDVPAPTIVVTPASIFDAAVGASYNQILSASGGAGSYRFGVSAGAFPAGLTLSPTGRLSGTPTAGGSFSFTVTATDDFGQTGTQAYNMAVTSPTLTLPSATLMQGQKGIAYSDAIDPAVGGTAPYSYAITAGALPAGITLSASGALSGTPSVDGTFNFSVTATDSSTGAGPYSDTQSYALTIIEATPVTGAVTATVAYNSDANAVTLNLSGGAAASVAVATQPANGTASAVGTDISYTPNVGFAGTDSFTYTATNAGGTSAPATISITVSDPAISIVASGPLDAEVGTPFVQSFIFSGGAQPYTAYQVTGLPAGLSVTGATANSVSIGGTPVQSGIFTLDVSAADSSTGNGPFTTTQSFSLGIEAPELAMNPASGSFVASYAEAFNQPLEATGGIGPFSYALSGTLPTGITLDADTGALSGTATVVGNFAFTVTATDTGSMNGAGASFKVQGDYTLEVTAPAIDITPPTLPTGTANSAYSAALAASGAVAPYSFALSGGTLPTGISLASDGRISGTPTAAGDFAFTVTAADGNGQTGTANFTLTIGNAVLTITPDTLPAGVQGMAYSQQLSTTGGIAPYSYVVLDGELPAGLTLGTGTGLISGTPTGSGVSTFVVRVTDSTGGTPSTRDISFTVTIAARPNPANDPEVRGLVQAQVNGARRLVETQIGNFGRRLEGMRRGGGQGGIQNGLRLSSADRCTDTMTAWTNSICANSGPNGWNNRPGGSGPMALGGNGGNLLASGVPVGGAAIGGTSPGSEDRNAAAGVGGAQDLPWTLWAGGTIRYGDRDEATGRPSQRFESEGVTFGADYRFNPAFAAGIGIGLGREGSDVGRNGTRSRGEAKTLAIYGSHLLGRGIYVDWLAGHQWLDFDLRRYVTLTGDVVNASRKGHQWFGSLSAGADIETGDWRFTTYTRLDAQRGTLDGYTEESGSVFDLTFLDHDMAFTSISGGAKIDYQVLVENGYFIPRIRIEYQRDIERDGRALVAYFDQTSGPFNVIPIVGYSRSRLLFGAGMEMVMGERTAVDVEYSHRRNGDAGSDQGVLVNITQAF